MLTYMVYEDEYIVETVYRPRPTCQLRLRPSSRCFTTPSFNLKKT